MKKRQVDQAVSGFLLLYTVCKMTLTYLDCPSTSVLKLEVFLLMPLQEKCSLCCSPISCSDVQLTNINRYEHICHDKALSHLSELTHGL